MALGIPVVFLKGWIRRIKQAAERDLREIFASTTPLYTIINALYNLFSLYIKHIWHTLTHDTESLSRALSAGQQCVSSDTCCAKSMAACSLLQWTPPFHWLPPSAAERQLTHLWGCLQWASSTTGENITVLQNACVCRAVSSESLMFDACVGWVCMCKGWAYPKQPQKPECECVCVSDSNVRYVR